MAWHARLSLEYGWEARTLARFSHDGPLRILQSLYPEGDAVCHNVLVHPPGGLVGGDTLAIDIVARAGSHGLVTTPGATRFYRSLGDSALQSTRIRVDAGARMEWLPMEALCYSGCVAQNRMRIEVARGGEFIGWDLTALGLPHAGQPFDKGSLLQHIEAPGVWLERGRIAASDSKLMDSPLGLAGHRCIASVFFIAGEKLDRARRERALDAARAVIDAHPLKASAGATSPHGQVLVLRMLAPVVEPAMGLARAVWAAWRRELWHMDAPRPRIWAT